ncbi:MAG TPA: hypothetical protein DEE98_07590 [Elusimicrobia bacterium]|nr:MAG: hypothetical protein A2278_00430 [Elusimicrobia bacterium RIFOXYA12_FULL_49_49]OGS06625.1 MAG: hypothetical protein A2204_00340 [Elusimicrobia bacterium RIFOXYA1_FULL_47_7]OGS11035.1 MAG: hypothetical protein A2386_00485 [Elusimicrobia bacterium RIFOXYB1_FULL_48_9]OGS15126.1 MAG: hypothetical protein A2251_00440 [Elusimicrobia bacterium RIFOXYA2_FULL_47_53]OGS29746.1 MAG: hypothetical protein A2323_01240 [Elusimicrobia bacterium RIFOXYB2_FULL_46_23]HBU70225.1 hypothetical protein [Elus
MNKKIEKIHLIINPAAGKEEAILHIFNIAMKEAGIKWEASITHKKGDGILYAKTAVKQAVDAVAVYGGDGALMEAVSGLIGTEIPLIILPGGSTNSMATELGIPDDLKEACSLITRVPLKWKTIDVGQFDDRYFITGLSIGFGADLVKGADREAKNKNGILAYFFSAAEALKRVRRTRYHIKVDSNEFMVRGLTCIVANSGNLGFTKTSLDKHIDVSDGLLDVVIVRKANLNLLKHLIITLLKRERPHDYELVQHWQGKEISITSSLKQVVQCDGEILDNIPPLIKVLPAAIRVIVPKQ